MNNGSRLPLIFMGGGTFCHSKTVRESSQPGDVLLFSSAYLHTRPSDSGQKWDSSTTAGRSCRPLVAFTCHFFLSLSLQEMHLKCCWSGVYRRFCDNKYKDDARRLCWKTSRIERELQGVRRCRGVTLQWHCWSQVKNKTAPCSKTACKRRGRTNMFSLYSCL